MKTQVEHARNGKVTEQMEKVTKTEGIDLPTLISNIASNNNYHGFVVNGINTTLISNTAYNNNVGLFLATSGKVKQ